MSEKPVPVYCNYFDCCNEECKSSVAACLWQSLFLNAKQAGEWVLFV